MSGLQRAETKGFPDPFSREADHGKPIRTLLHALLANALFRCWHIIVFFSAWATFVTLYNVHVHPLIVQPTLLTVFGTVLGFVVSYRTSSGFERYNEGRKYWSQIVYASRTLARVVWFHIPDNTPISSYDPSIQATEEMQKARVLVEKKTIVNLIQAFGVAVKHYLRGEDGIYYQDLYYLVKFLPAYALPSGKPSDSPEPTIDETRGPAEPAIELVELHAASSSTSPLDRKKSVSFAAPEKRPPLPTHWSGISEIDAQKRTPAELEAEAWLLPAFHPPRHAWSDFFPVMSWTVTKHEQDIQARRAQRLKEKLGTGYSRGVVSHNVPLEISLYLSSYVAATQNKKLIDAPTSTSLQSSLSLLVDALTGLERILTTPIPFSYAFHLWCTTFIYCMALPFQLYPTLKMITIPATAIASFIFFGFLVAGEEIENPFGYGKNDLNMDYFTHHIIRRELHALTSASIPDPAVWAFAAHNDLVFNNHTNPRDGERVTPGEWIQRGVEQMREELSI